MDQLAARELINSGWAVASLVIVFLFTLRIAIEARWTNKGWYSDKGNQAAVAFLFYFIGETGYRLWIFGILFEIDTDTGYFAASDHYGVAFFFGTIALIGLLCAIRIFTKEIMGNWGWFATLLVTVGVLAAVRTAQHAAN